jgi:hypothetical protein
VSTPVARFVLVISALAATLMLGGAGAGLALAEPDGSSTTSDTDPSTGTDEAPPAPEPTVIPAPTPRTLSEQLNDIFRRPLSIFGNGRVPGQLPSTAVEKPPDSKFGSNRSGVFPRKPDTSERSTPAPSITLPESASSAEVRLPYTPPISVPLPTVPGTDGLRLSIDLSDPAAAYATVDETFNTFNSLLADAYAPIDPFPSPTPEPSFRTMEEEPIDADGNVTDLFSAGGDRGLPVLQAPIIPPGLAAPRGFPEPIRGGSASPEVIGGGTAGVRGVGIRGSVKPNGSVQAEGLPGGTAAPVSRPALNQGYTQYLRSAPIGELVIIALPGLIGLVALTASGSVVGYRQANAGRRLHVDAVRFMP